MSQHVYTGAKFNQKYKSRLHLMIKLINEKGIHHGYTYVEGLNIIPEGKLSYNTTHSKGGFYFTFQKYLFDWINGSPSGEMKYVCTVEIPDDAQVFVESKKSIKTDRYILSNKQTIKNFLTTHPEHISDQMAEVARDQTRTIIDYLSCLPMDSLHPIAELRLIKYGSNCVCYPQDSEELMYMKIIYRPKSILTLPDGYVPHKILLISAIQSVPHLILDFIQKDDEWSTYDLCLMALQDDPSLILSPKLFVRYFLDNEQAQKRMDDFIFFCYTTLRVQLEGVFTTKWKALPLESKQIYPESYLQYFVKAFPTMILLLKTSQQDSELLYIIAGKQKLSLIKTFVENATLEKQLHYLSVISINVIDYIQNPSLDIVRFVMSQCPKKTMMRLPLINDKAVLLDLLHTYPQLLMSVDMSNQILTKDEILTLVQRLQSTNYEFANNERKFVSNLVETIKDKNIQLKIVSLYPDILRSLSKLSLYRRQWILMQMLNDPEWMNKNGQNLNNKVDKHDKTLNNKVQSLDRCICGLLKNGLSVTLLDVSPTTLQYLAYNYLHLFELKNRPVFYYLVTQHPRSILTLENSSSSALMYSLQRDPSIINEIQPLNRLQKSFLPCVRERNFEPSAAVVSYLQKLSHDDNDSDEDEDNECDDFDDLSTDEDEN